MSVAQASTGSAPADAAAEAPALPRRLLDAFFSPGKMVEYVAREPRWLGALLVSMALLAVSTSLIPPELIAEVQRRAALERGVTMPPLTDETLRIIRIISIVGPALGFALLSFVLSGLYTFVFAFVLGDEGRYRQYLAVFAHSSIIPALLSLPLTPLRIATGDVRLSLNIGTFLVFLEPGYVLNVFRLMDLTQIWSAAVFALGARAIDRRRGLASAFVILMCFALALALIGARFLPT